MTGREVVQRIRENQATPWNDRSMRDTFKLGDPDSQVKGIATTMMTTFGMLKRAHEQGLNMIVSHEDTWWNDPDSTKDLQDNPLYKMKRDFVLQNGMILWRDHDNMHAQARDFTVIGEMRSAGIKGGENSSMYPGVMTIPETTLGEFASQVKRSSGAHAFRCVGDPKAKISRILVGPGYATPAMTAEADVVVGGERQEADSGFDNVGYVRDAAALGIAKGVIMLGHVISEEAGMEDMANWMRTFITEVPIRFVPAGEPFWT